VLRLQATENVIRVGFESVEEPRLLGRAIAELEAVASIGDRAGEPIEGECPIDHFPAVSATRFVERI
jgi:hypothetical protein